MISFKYLKSTFLIFFCVVIFYNTDIYAQQDAQYTQYMYNTVTINPAYAGSRDVLTIFGLYRSQWVGLDGAPETKTFAINTPINNSNFGLGLSIISDRIGPSEETNVAVDFSYFVPISQKFKLSFGLKTSVNVLNIDWSKLTIFHPLDARLNYNIDNRFAPNLGAGLYLHSNKSYIGISVPHFFESQHYDRNSINSGSSIVAKQRLHYYFIAGHVFDLTDGIQFKPAGLLKIISGAPAQIDLSANFLYNQKFMLGAAYRFNAAISGMVGFQVSKTIFMGYAYDVETSFLRRFNSGSHEIFLRFELFKSIDKINSPRFF